MAMVLFFAVSFVPTAAHAFIPFGGPIVSIQPCDGGTAWLIRLGPPTPFNLIYVTGTPVFREGPPRHPGQFMLGIATGGGLCDTAIGKGTFNVFGFVITPITGTSL